MSALMGTPYAEVIGDPIGHSKSPAIHGFWLARLGIEGDYRAAHVRPEALAAYFADRRADPDWRGCNVTVPHKQAVMPLADTLSALAREVGAANIVIRAQGGLAADNSDVAGIIDALAAAGLPDGPLNICLIGSGGAARAALAAFASIPGAQVALNVRDQAKGRALLAEFALSGRCGPLDDADNVLGADLLVNATILGMSGQPPMPEALLAHVAGMRPGAVVFDMVYAPLETALLAAARRRGLRTVDGLSMLIGQAAAAFERFFGAPAPRAHDAELRAVLTS